MIWNNTQKLKYGGEKMNKIFIKNILIVVSLKVDNSMYVQKYKSHFALQIGKKNLLLVETKVKILMILKFKSYRIRRCNSIWSWICLVDSNAKIIEFQIPKTEIKAFADVSLILQYNTIQLAFSDTPKQN